MQLVFNHLQALLSYPTLSTVHIFVLPPQNGYGLSSFIYNAGLPLLLRSIFNYVQYAGLCNGHPLPTFFYISYGLHIFSFLLPNTSYSLTSTTCNTGLFFTPIAVYFQPPIMRTYLFIPPYQLRLVFSPLAIYLQSPGMRVSFSLPPHQLWFMLPLFLLWFSFNYL